MVINKRLVGKKMVSYSMIDVGWSIKEWGSLKEETNKYKLDSVFNQLF